jgi:hypothetical protein
MTKYNHMLDIAFEVISEEEDGSDITPEQIHVAIAKRIALLVEANEFNVFSVSGAISICDTYEMKPCEFTEQFKRRKRNENY